uniref:BHLH domain-containing protein n=1 Tax=Acrobeloides nanus TaxID=290746 RepID=A0A914C6V8_9BILA
MNNQIENFKSKNQEAVDSLIEEDFEPYIRRKRVDKERHKNRLQNLDEEQQDVLRTCINSRERRRMHDLNDALDQLRQALPTSQEANSRKMSKINTILHASSRLRWLTRRNEELQRRNQELSARLIEAGIPIPPIANGSTVDLMPPAILPPIVPAISSQPHSVSPTINGFTLPGAERIPFLDMTRVTHQFLASIPTALQQQRPMS